MTSGRRKGIESSVVRAQLVQAAMRIVADEGVHAVTTRRLAEAVGLSRYTVHYYFGTMDDLYVAVIEEQGDQIRARLAEALRTTNPLQVIWELGSSSAPQTLEFTALAIRRPEIRKAAARFQDQFHNLFIQAINDDLARRGLSVSIPTSLVVAVVQSLSQWAASAEAIETSSDRTDVLDAVHSWLAEYAQSGELPFRSL
jgi:TetR/AcrR family transcriptional regulator